MKFNERKRKIIDTAHQLFIKKGFHTTSIQDIIDKTGISKGTFYNYFNSKNECLLAILETVQAEGDLKRMELALGKDPRDEEVFIQQIAVRSDMNRKYSLLVLFEAIAHLDDPEIKRFLKKQYQTELKWTANRLSEIYTPEVHDYSMDHAVMVVGMIHHFMHAWKLKTEEDIEAEIVVRFILNRLKPIIQEQLQTGERFFSEDWFDAVLDQINPDEISAHLVRQIDKLLIKANATQLEYLHFLKGEVMSQEPRLFLIESVLLSLKHQFEDTNMWHDVRQIIQIVKKFLEYKGDKHGV